MRIPDDADQTYEQALAKALEEPTRTIVEVDPPFALVATSEQIQQEILDDPTFPWETWPEGQPKPKRKGEGTGKRGPALNEDQQMQIALWIAGGYQYRDAVDWMLRDWGFAITRRTWQYYQQSRGDLVDKATKYLVSQFQRMGYGSPAVVFSKLARHADILERYILQRGLYETEVHVIGYGKNEKRVSSEKFTDTLSKEWRNTVKQIADLSKDVWGRAATMPGGGDEKALSPELQQRFLAAAKWQKGGTAGDVDEGAGE